MNKKLLWLVIILVVVAVGAYVGWNFFKAGPISPADTSLKQLEKQGTSDELSAIEADLNATDLSNLDKELGDIGKELGL